LGSIGTTFLYWQLVHGIVIAVANLCVTRRLRSGEPLRDFAARARGTYNRFLPRAKAAYERMFSHSEKPK
jgi:hypothetical protein